jgi:hypothetical protein
MAVFIGPGGIGRWQGKELDAFFQECMSRECPIIPVILPEVKGDPIIPPFLRPLTWVDFRIEYPDPFGN